MPMCMSSRNHKMSSVLLLLALASHAAAYAPHALSRAPRTPAAAVLRHAAVVAKKFATFDDLGP